MLGNCPAVEFERRTAFRKNKDSAHYVAGIPLRDIGCVSVEKQWCWGLVEGELPWWGRLDEADHEVKSNADRGGERGVVSGAILSFAEQAGTGSAELPEECAAEEAKLAE